MILRNSIISTVPGMSRPFPTPGKTFNPYTNYGSRGERRFSHAYMPPVRRSRANFQGNLQFQTCVRFNQFLRFSLPIFFLLQEDDSDDIFTSEELGGPAAEGADGTVIR